jgi:hypothetical protein
VTKTTKWLVFGIGGAVVGYLLYKKFLSAPATANPTAPRVYTPAPMPLLPVTVRNNPQSFVVSATQIRGTGTFTGQRWIRSGNTWVFSPLAVTPISTTNQGTSAVAGLSDVEEAYT